MAGNPMILENLSGCYSFAWVFYEYLLQQVLGCLGYLAAFLVVVHRQLILGVLDFPEEIVLVLGIEGQLAYDHDE